MSHVIKLFLFGGKKPETELTANILREKKIKKNTQKVKKISFF